MTQNINGSSDVTDPELPEELTNIMRSINSAAVLMCEASGVMHSL